MACGDWAAKVGGGVLGRVWALIAALALLLGLAVFAPAPAQAASFKDVPSGQWYTSWVDQASDQGLMSGFTDPATGRPTGYFGPGEPLTRAQVATVLWRMAGGPSSGHASFPDVERGSWYDAPVAWCVKAGVVTGYTSGPDRGCFRPDRPVTRQELATMVYRYAKHAGMDVTDPDPAAFRSTTDWRTVDSWASEALTWTAAAGVLSGVDNHDGTYSVVPFGTATRAMAAKVFVVLSGSPSAAKASYTVTFNSNGGSAVKAQTVKSGAKASKPADPTKSGYTFKGWYTDTALTEAYDFGLPVKANLTLYAKWEAESQPYAILYKDGLLSLQAGSGTDPSHGEVLGKWAWDGSSSPWYDERARVRSVVATDRVAVSNGYGMFSDLANCRSVDLSRLDVSNASDLSYMFSGCSSLTSLDLSGWDVSNASDLSWMFSGCSRLQSLDLSGWGVSNVSDLSYMFSGCSSLQALDLSGWDVSAVTSFVDVFSGCQSLNSVTLGAGCGLLVDQLPSGPWYDAEGKEFDRPPAGVAGTFTKTKPATLAVAADVVSDAEALLPAQIVEGEQDGLRYVVVPEGASFEYGLEYPELAGRYVGPGVYFTGYVGEGDSLVVPLEVAGVPVVSANLSWNDSDRAGMTRLATVTFERIAGKASLLAQLDVSGNGLSSLDIEGLDALVRLNCEGNPIADLAALQAWAAQDGHEAKLPQVQDAVPAEPGDAVAPSEPSAPEQPSEPDVPAVGPSEPSEPEVPAEPNVPGEPSEPEVPSKPSEPEVPSEPETPSEPEEPSEEPAPDEGPSDDSATSDEGDPVSDSLDLGEEPVSALAA